MSEHTGEHTNDRALRFYHEVLGLERLHYGLWQKDDALTFDNLKAAQQRYEDLLISHIPADVKSILDVGCGTGVMSANLKARHYHVEGLTPDRHQKEVINKQVNIELHFVRFEDFSPTKTYDCIIMSESSQYIPLDKLFRVAGRALKPKGYLMICDYFVLNHARGIMAKSGHNYDAFLSTAQDAGFKIIHSQDITPQTAVTLDMADDCCHRALLAVDIATEKIRKRHPILTRLFLKLFDAKIRKATRQRRLLDSNLFKANKRYQFLLFQSNRSAI